MMNPVDTHEADSGSRQPAPGDLALVQALLNTVDFELDTDDLQDPAGLGVWLASAGLLQPAEIAGLGEPERQRVVGLREAIRGVVQANTGGAVDPADAALVERESDRAGIKVEIGPDGVARLTACRAGLDGAVARLLAALVAAGMDGSWRRLKACREHTCRWAFYDRSRNGSSTWCSMAVCGNRAKARRHRQRRRTDTAEA